MAYNPFNIFRRNQKAIFAVITVFIMFTFVLSSGLGGGADFFDWLPNWLGQKAKKGDHVCTIDGTKVYQSDLMALRAQRQQANRFMTYAAEEAAPAIGTWAMEQRAQLGPEAKKAFEDLEQAQSSYQSMVRLIMQNSQGQIPPGVEAFLGQSRQAVVRAAEALRALATKPGTPPADREVITAMNAAQELLQTVQAGRGQYFLESPNRTDRDLIDFMLWQKKADQLGIKLTEADVKLLVRREFMNQFNNDVNVRKRMQEGGRAFSADETYKAIGEEFRVRMAQRAYLGLGPVSAPNQVLSAPAVFAPPYEVFDFYRDKFSPTTYQVLAIPGRSMAYLVQGTPTEAEREQLYEKYNNLEPDPSREAPGLKEPRRVKVGWIGLSGNEPYYQKLAAEALDKKEAAAKLIGGLTVPLPGVGAGWAAAAAGDAGFTGRYPEAVAAHWRDVQARLEASPLPRQPLDTSVMKPHPLAALAAAELANVGSLGNPFSPLVALQDWAGVEEMRVRVAAGIRVFFGAVPGPGMEAALAAGRAAFTGNLPRPLPPDVLAAEWRPFQVESEARQLAVADLQKLQKELTALTDKLKGPNDKAELARQAGEVLAKFEAARGLKPGENFGESRELRDEWTLGDDPGLAKLEEAMRGPHGGRAVGGFGTRFFWDREMTSRGETKKPASGIYRPQPYPAQTLSEFAPGMQYLAWRTDEAPGGARIPNRTAARTSTRVVEAWKLLHGREMAKVEAEKIAEQIRNTPEVPRAFLAMAEVESRLRSQVKDKAPNEPKAAERIDLFNLRVAPLEVPSQFGALNPLGQLDLIEGDMTRLSSGGKIPYPTPEMAKTLIEDRTQPPKTVMVLSDAPKDTYYVVLLVDRTMKTPIDFSRDNTAAYGAYFRQAGKEAHDAVMSLLKAELKYVETDEQKKKIDTTEGSRNEE